MNILCIGSFIEVKGHRYLFEACRELRRRGVDFRCELVGEGPGKAEFERALEADGPPPLPRHGACVQFFGVVRDTEDGRPIEGIDYRAYPKMVEAVMAAMAREGAEEFGDHTVKIHHRVGFVPAAEPSVVIRVTTRHSQAAFDICRRYLHRLKTEIPEGLT